VSQQLQDELRAAFDAGVDAGDRGFADQSEELDIEFAVHLKHRAARARRQRLAAGEGGE
jgi:hypothetical protein